MKRIAHALPATVHLSALAGCGSVVTEEAAASSSGATGSGAGGGGSVAASSGVTTGSGGAGGGCSEPSETLTIDLVAADGTPYGCGGAPKQGDVDLVLQGRIQEIAPGVMTLDTCPPDANCLPSLVTFSVKAKNFKLTLAEGTFVELRLRVATSFGCGAKLLITELDKWGGVPNPAAGLGPVLLAASNGYDSSFPEAPFGMDKQSVCTMGPAGGAEAFALRFFVAGEAPGSGVTVPQGGDVDWYPPFQKQGPLMIRNLRSFDSGLEDDDWNWSYLVVPSYYVD